MIVKKTVAIHPVMDSFVRKMWAILIENGYDASYSTALNYMLLGHIRSVQERGLDEVVVHDLNDFLRDEKTISELDLADYVDKIAVIRKTKRK
ncbi:MAG TPA: hypothetical protein VNI77_06200 [Nitrososphaera sp.]|nr:hypothetical protein [Nitrososphaera sp.]